MLCLPADICICLDMNANLLAHSTADAVVLDVVVVIVFVCPSLS